MLMYDTLSGRFFETDKTVEEVKEGLEKLNAVFKGGGIILECDYYDAIGAPSQVYYSRRGWCYDRRSKFDSFKICEATLKDKSIGLYIVRTP